MKLIIAVLGVIMVKATTVLAASGQEKLEVSLLTIIFLVFGAIIIVGQLVPCLMLFFSMLKGLFDHAEKKTMPKTGAKI